MLAIYLNFLGVLLFNSTFDAGVNGTKYEMLAICLRSKQNCSELLGRAIIYYRSPYLLGKKYS